MKDNFISSIAYGLAAAYGAFCAYLELDPLVTAVILGAFVFDYGTGVLKSFSVKSYQSKVGIVGLLAKAVGLAFVFFLGFALKVFNVELGNYVTMALLMALAFNDILSSLSNLHAARTGESLPEIDAISAVFRAVHSFIKGIIDKFITKIKG